MRGLIFRHPFFQNLFPMIWFDDENDDDDDDDDDASLSLRSSRWKRRDQKTTTKRRAKRERERERERETTRTQKLSKAHLLLYSTTKGWSKNEPLFFMRRFEEEEKGLFSLSRVRLNNANKNTRKIDVPKRAASSRTTTPPKQSHLLIFYHGLFYEEIRRRRKRSLLSLSRAFE